MTRVYTSGAAVKTTTRAAMSDISPANGEPLFVTDTTGYPTDGPFVICINRDPTGLFEEKLLVTFDGNINGEFVLDPLLGRGFDDTTPTTHQAGSPVEHVLDAQTIMAINEHIHNTTLNDHPQYGTHISNTGLDNHTQYLNGARHDALTSAFHLTSARRGVTVCTAATRPTGVEGTFIYETDTNRTLFYDGTNWTFIGKPYGKTVRTGGDVTLSSTTWADVDTGMDIALPAVAGDVITVTVDGGYAVTSGETTYMDVRCTQSGAYFGAAVQTNTGSGIRGLQSAGANGFWPFHGTFYRTIAAGDIGLGFVTLRLRYREVTGGAARNTLDANVAAPFSFFARNLGPDVG